MEVLKVKKYIVLLLPFNLYLFFPMNKDKIKFTFIHYEGMVTILRGL